MNHISQLAILATAVVLSSLFSGPAQAARFLAKADGAWSSTATWGGQGPPGNGDVAIIKDGVTVTVTDARIIGMSGATGTVAIDLNNAGALIVAAGGKLQVRGDIIYVARGGGNNTPYLTVQGGGTFEWDSSTSNPTSTQYTAHPDSAYGYRPFVTAGTAASHAIVRSNPGGGNGFWRCFPATVCGAYSLTYTDFLRIGDAKNPAFHFLPPGDHGNHTPWDATHNTFRLCGMVADNGAAAGEDVFRHSFNVHSGSLAPAIMAGGAQGGAHLCTAVGVPAGCQSVGIREMIGNVFDTNVSNAFDALDFTIRSNYFANRMQTHNQGADSWASFQNNFFRVTQSAVLGSIIQPMSDVHDNLWFLDEAVSNNPHGPSPPATHPVLDSGSIMDHAGKIIRSVSAYFICLPTASISCTLQNAILLPNAEGHSSWWLTAAEQQPGSPGSPTYNVTHNTAMIDTTGGNVSSVGVYTAHGGTSAEPAGQLAKFTNNILWNPSSNPKSFAYKILPGQNVNLDVCHPADCDYNDGWNMKTDGGPYKNGGRGYADNFTSTPGVHDVAVDPMFVDPSRNTATFDSAYLNNHPAAWSASATYKFGDMVSSADPGVFGNEPINYRYVNGQGCDASNPKPGLLGGIVSVTNNSRTVNWVSGPKFNASWATSPAGNEVNLPTETQCTGTLECQIAAVSNCTGSLCTTMTLTSNYVGGVTGNLAYYTTAQPLQSRACWEWASLYQIRQGVAKQTVFNDPSIGVQNGDIITALIHWIRAGYAPTNPALAHAGSDGRHPGAVPPSSAPRKRR